MLTYKGIPLPAIVCQYMEGATERDQAILRTRAWMDAANVRIIKQNTSLATMRMTAWILSQGRADTDEMKGVLVEYFQATYRVSSVFFYQSEHEMRQSRQAHLYFHAICDIREASNLGR